MAFDSSSFSSPQEGSCCMPLGWHCDFYFGYGFDVLEEDALNEKHCIQVLRVLITKADTEIDELEKDLVFLQNELAWVEYEEWSEICCNALRKQIDCLCFAVRSMKSKDRNNFEVRFLMYRKPHKRLHEILKALLRDYCNDKDNQNEQTPDVAVLDSSFSPGSAAETLSSVSPGSAAETLSSVSPGSAAEILEGNAEFDNFDSSVVEEIKASRFALTDNNLIFKTPLMNQEETDNPDAVKKVRHTNGKDSKPLSLKSEAGHFDEKKVLSGADLDSAMKGEARERCFTPKSNKVVQTLTFKSTYERRHNVQMVKIEPPDIMSKNTSGDVSKHAVGHSNKKKKMSSFNIKIKSEEPEENSSTSTADVLILDSSLNPKKKSTKFGKRFKLVDTVGKDLGSNACAHKKGHNNVMSTMCNSDLEINGNKEVTSKNKILGLSSSCKGELNSPKADKPVNSVVQNVHACGLRHAIVVCGRSTNSYSSLTTPVQAKDGNSDSSVDSLRHTKISMLEKDENYDNSIDSLRLGTDLNGRRNKSDSALATSRQLRFGNSDISTVALKHATGLNQRRNNFDSKFGAFGQAKGGNCDIDQKLCEFAQKSARKRGFRESILTPANKLKSSFSSSEAEAKGKPSLQIVKVEKSDLTDTEESALTSLLKLQDDEGKNSNRQLEEAKMAPEKVQRTETLVRNKFIIDLSVKPQKQYSKRKFKSNPPSLERPYLLSAEMDSNSSFTSKAKYRLKSGLGSDTSSSNQAVNEKKTKKIVTHRQCKVEEDSSALDDGQNLISQPQKKRKMNSSLPVLVEIKGSTLQMDLLKSHRDLKKAIGNDDLLIPESYEIESCTEIVTSPFASSKLKELKVCELRAIAKEQKLTKYHKLRKNDLAEQIANKLGSC